MGIELTPEVRAEAVRQARAELWRRGQLSYKFHATQRKIYEALNASKSPQFYLLCSRRLGKTFTLLCLCFEQAIRHPNSNILFIAPLAFQAVEIFKDVLKFVMEDAPPDLDIEVREHTKEVLFKFNNSIIRLKGVNNEQADNIRGGALDLVVIDECGSVDRLEYLVSSVAMPATLTKRGRIILATTPPVTPGHDSVKLYKDLFARGATVKFTLLDAPESHLSYEQKTTALMSAHEAPEDIPLILAGKMEPRGTTALREYFCEFVTDANMAVVPEFRSAKREIVHKHERPSLYDAYVSVDPGQVDKTAIVFASYDFRNGVIYVEDEALLHKPTTNKIAEVVLDREFALWGNEKPYKRIVDNDLRLIGDLQERHGLTFQSAYKPGAKNGINLLRTMINNRELVIDPKCEQLIMHLETAVWNNNASGLARSGEGEDRHHFDMVDALKYLVRSVDMQRNPYPAGHPDRSLDRWRSPKQLRKPAGIRAGQRGQQLDLLGSTPLAKRLKGKTK